MGIHGRFDIESPGGAVDGSVRSHSIHGERQPILESKLKMISVSAHTWILILVGFLCGTSLKTGRLDAP